jgi:cell division protein FtsL
MIRRVPSRQRNRLIAPEKDRDAFLRLGLLLFCGLGLASGFVYAGRQHFAALKLGYDTERLRRERNQVAEEQRRFLLLREEAASPARLERAAKQLGMQALQPAQIDPLRQTAKLSTKEVLPASETRPSSPARNAQTRSKPSAKTQMNHAVKKPI